MKVINVKEDIIYKINQLPDHQIGILDEIITIFDKDETHIVTKLVAELAKTKLMLHRTQKEMRDNGDMIRIAFESQIDRIDDRNEDDLAKLGEIINSVGETIKERDITIIELELRIQGLEDEKRSI